MLKYILLLGLVSLAACFMRPMPEGGLAYKLLLEKYPEMAPSNDIPSYIEMPIDHFNPISKTFKNKYYLNENTCIHGPCSGSIVYFNGEAPLKGNAHGYIENIAEKHNLRIYSMEHRFYGESMPEHGLRNEHIQYLRVTQAMADVAHLIRTFSENGPFITVGGSYSGALQSFFRTAYPDLTIGGWSSSGVVNALYEFPEFDEQIQISADHGGFSGCSEKMIQTRIQYEDAIRHGRGKSVKGLTGSENMDDADFFYMVADSMSMAVQYGHKDALCNPLISASANELIPTFANFTNHFWGKEFGGSCFYDTNCLADVNQEKRWQPTGRNWRAQKCFDLAYFQVAPVGRSIRSRIVDLKYHIDQCNTIFGDAMPAGAPVTKAMNSQFGGDFPKATKTIYTNFFDDPWQRAGVNTKFHADTDVESFAACDFCGHCRDLHKVMPNDPIELVQTRMEIAAFFDKIFKEYHNNQ